MKVNIGPYRDWIGPYQIVQKIFFWKDPHSDFVLKLSEKLDDVKWFREFCEWVYKKRQRKIRVHIHGYDVWNMDNTLALIVVPMLEKLQESKQGYPYVDDDDVPDNIKSTSAPELSEEQKNCGHTDAHAEARWAWVHSEMTWAFRQHASSDWQESYYSGMSDFKIIDGKLVNGPNDTFKIDHKGLEKHKERMRNGLRLFAKYYESLWD
jgi:hypothetical protein